MNIPEIQDKIRKFFLSVLMSHIFRSYHRNYHL